MPRRSALFVPIKKEIERARNKMRAQHKVSTKPSQRKQLEADFKILQGVHTKLGFGRLDNFEV